MTKTLFVAVLCALCAGCQTHDEMCREWGAKPGSDQYIQCRALLAKSEEQSIMTGAALGTAVGAYSRAGASRR